MIFVFWGSALLIVYAYAGYAGWLWLRSRWVSRPVRRGESLPVVSVVMVVRNEAGVLQRKLENLLRLSYPADRYEIVVVSDGSTDATDSILQRFAGPRLRTIRNAASRGKAAGLNDGIALAGGEVILFTDARQMIEAQALGMLVENFSDSSVGCVSGELMLGDPESGEAAQGMGIYWKIEKTIRDLESASGSVVGATGALYAVRKSLLVPVPADTILDDVYLPMWVVRQGSRVIFEPRARAWDTANQGARREFARKVRTLSGNYQLLQLAPWLLGRSNPLRFEFVCHKLLRLVVPFALIAFLVASAWLGGPFYRIALLLQLGFYGMSLLAMTNLFRGPVARVADAAFTFVVLNSAAMVAFTNFVSGRKAVWIRS